jgi:uncharacterized protein YdbL (DUF1318 family)
MKTTRFRFLATLAVLAVGLTTAIAIAQDLGAVKARIAQRLPQVDSLKAKGVLGENNRGFVESRGGDAAAGAVIAEENSDRETVYAALAKQTGTSAEQVGRARAKQIAAASASGVWLQRDDGTWYKK